MKSIRNFMTTLSIKNRWSTKNSKCNNVFLSKSRNFQISCSSLKDLTPDNVDSKLKTKENNSGDLREKKDFSPALTEEERKEAINALKSGDPLYPFKTPTEKVLHYLKEDFKYSSKKLVKFTTGIQLGELEWKYFPRECDILIVGSGLIGLSVAYALKTEHPHMFNITVLDKSCETPQHNLNLAAGTLTQQNCVYEEEVEMAKYCAQVLSDFHLSTSMPECLEGFRVPYEPLGSLVLANERNAEAVLNNQKLLQSCQVPSKILGVEKIQEKFSWLNTEGLEFGCYTTINEGIVDPWAFAHGMKCKLFNMGVKFATAELIDFGMQDNAVRRAICQLPDKSLDSITFGLCVIAAGMGSQKIINTINAYEKLPLKVRIPEEERMRYEYCFHNPQGPGLNTPMITNPDKIYFRREGLTNLFVVGVDGVTHNSEMSATGVFEVFDERIKPFLTNQISNFTDVELKSGWIDSYSSNKANELGVLGRHPTNSEILFAIGFTNRGITYAPAVGRSVMEDIVFGKYKTIDMTRFQVQNLWLKQHLEAEECKRKKIEEEIRLKLSEM